MRDLYLIFDAAVIAEQSNPNEALRLYQEVLEIDPEFAAAHLNIGTVYYSEGDLGKACDHYLEAVRIEPTYALAYFNLGIVWGRIHFPQKAIAAYDKALAINPRYADALYNLAATYEELKMFQKARSLWKQYAALDPSGYWHDQAVRRAKNIVASNPIAIATRDLSLARRR